MIDFLAAFKEHAVNCPDVLAFYNTAGEEMTYGQLEAQSNSIASFLLDANPQAEPVALYGHKSPMMLACIIGCMRAGCAFVPLDTLYPSARINGILGQLGGGAIALCTTQPHCELQAGRLVGPEELAQIASTECAPVADEKSIEGDDPFYILFTSGSTGTPKGVVQRAEAADCNMRYVERFIPDAGEHQVHFNRTPYCFDMGLLNAYSAIPRGHTVFMLEEEAEKSMSAIFQAFKKSGATLWFSTPTFLKMCLVDPSFNEELLPNLRSVFMGGEVLHNSTVRSFMERFPKARIWNTYGPTETGVFVTDVEITAGMAAGDDALPIGSAGPDVEIHIVDRETMEEVPCGEAGEICILGGQVGAGYFNEPAKTAAVFIERKDHDGVVQRAYLSGDEASMDANGLIYFKDRFDKQVKINGFRIELGEIEEVLNKLPEVGASCVIVKQLVSNTALQAHVVLVPGVEGTRELTKSIKARLKESLPDYMVPRTVKYRDCLPMNVNGKVDRKALEAEGKR